MQIAIDGPAGAGKSTIAKALAKEMSMMYVDTGAMYRTIALCVSQSKADPENEKEVCEIACKADIKITFEDGKQIMYLDGQNVNDAIRTEETGNMASATSKYAGVRKRLVAMQQELAEKYDVVMDGRDIGTKVLPGADLKIFMTAQPQVRAKRRYDELLQKGGSPDYEEILKDIKNRDYNDSHREISPLAKADDAIELDTSFMDIQEVVNTIKSMLSA